MAARQFQRSLEAIKTTICFVATGEEHEIDGYAEEGVVLEENAGKYEEGKMSADGKYYEVNAINDQSGTVTIHIFPYSPAKEVFYKARKAKVGEDLVDLVMVDTINKLRHSAINCTLKESFKVEEGKARGQMAFVFQTPHLNLDVSI